MPRNALLQQHCRCGLGQPQTLGWGDFGIPCTCISGTNDAFYPLGLHGIYFERFLVAGVVVNRVVLDVGYCPNVSAPEKIVQVVRKVAGNELY